MNEDRNERTPSTDKMHVGAVVLSIYLSPLLMFLLK